VVLDTRAARVNRLKVLATTVSNWSLTNTSHPNQLSTGTRHCSTAAFEVGLDLRVDRLRSRFAPSSTSQVSADRLWAMETS
jgi:hypothetical protein